MDLWLLLPGWVASRIFFIGVATCGPLNTLGGTPQKLWQVPPQAPPWRLPCSQEICAITALIYVSVFNICGHDLHLLCLLVSRPDCQTLKCRQCLQLLLFKCASNLSTNGFKELCIKCVSGLCKKSISISHLLRYTFTISSQALLIKYA